MHQMNGLDVATINHTVTQCDHSVTSVTACKLRIIILHLSNDFSCCIRCDQVKKSALPLCVL